MSTFNFNSEYDTVVNSASLSISTTNAFEIVVFSLKVGSSLSPTSTSTSRFSVRITDGTNTYTSETITIPNGEIDTFTFAVNMTFNASATVRITFPTRSNVRLYGNSAAGTSYFYGASAAVLWNCSFTLGSGAWIIPSTGKYPELIENRRSDFTDWERDTNDYPLNPSIWRIDTNNLGYPWIWGYEAIGPFDGGIVYVKTASGAVPHRLYVKTASGAVAVRWQIKT